MCMTKSQQRGFTLIELIIFIVVVGVGVAGILSVYTTSIKNSADPLVRKQALAIAESLLEEILLKEYCDPDTATLSTKTPPAHPPKCDALQQEVLRADYDDLDDYDGKTQAVFLDWPTSLNAYTVAITVAAATAADNAALSSLQCLAVPPATAIYPCPAKKVTVTVTGPQGAISLTGYRANY